MKEFLLAAPFPAPFPVFKSANDEFRGETSRTQSISHWLLCGCPIEDQWRSGTGLNFAVGGRDARRE
jgi:hypothetical protein